MKHLGLFEGIGGFSLAARWMGWETVAWCEINPFCQKVLKHHFPEAEPLNDIKQTDFTPYANRIDILTGGFPCQPYSTAGKRLGKEDDRHLWPEMLRAIREIKPVWVVGENVRGLTNWNGGLVFDEVQIDLENEGFEIIPFLLPACAVNAPHRRDRIWFVAYSNNNRERKTGNCTTNARSGLTTLSPEGWERKCETVLHNRFFDLQRDFTNTSDIRLQQPWHPWKWWTGFKNNNNNDASNTNSIKLQGGGNQNGSEKAERHNCASHPRNERTTWENFPTQSPICGGNDGVPEKLDGITFSKWRNESIKAYGNAIVPQVALQIFKAIEQYNY